MQKAVYTWNFSVILYVTSKCFSLYANQKTARKKNDIRESNERKGNVSNDEYEARTMIFDGKKEKNYRMNKR